VAGQAGVEVLDQERARDPLGAQPGDLEFCAQQGAREDGRLPGPFEAMDRDGLIADPDGPRESPRPTYAR